jgi:hypothetical protein
LPNRCSAAQFAVDGELFHRRKSQIMKRETVPISTLTEKKQAQLQSSISIPPMYISIERFSLDTLVHATIYHIEIGIQKNDNVVFHCIDRRYSELYGLDTEIRKQFGDSHYLLDFPPKKFYGNKDPEFLQRRCEQLQKYLANLVMIPGISRSPSFTRFFLIDDSADTDL